MSSQTATEWVRVALAGLVVAGCVVLLIARKPWEVPPDDDGFYGLKGAVTAGTWMALAVDVVLVGLCALLLPWWAGSARAAVAASGLGRSKPRWFWPAVLAAMVVAAALWAPRLGAGLWDDEETSVRRCIAGTYRVTPEGSVVFKPVPWTATWFYYSTPNNHVLNSVAARLSHSLWLGVARPQGLPYSEPVLRLPAFLAALGGIGAAALLLAWLGQPGAGVLVAWLLAAHPWYARYAPEARGYAFLFALLPLVFLAGLVALRSGRWMAWGVFALAQIGALLAWPAAALYVAIFNAGLLVRMLASSELRPQAWRFVPVGAVVIAAVAHVYLPCALQVGRYAVKVVPTAMDPAWLANLAARFACGLPWKTSAPSGYPTADALLDAAPTAGRLAALLALAGLAVGVWRFRRFPELLAAFVLPPALMAAYSAVRHIPLFDWYFVSALPGVAVLVASGLAALCARASGGLPLRATLLGALCVGIGGWFVAGAHAALLTRPIAPVRESVLATRPNLDPHDPTHRTILTGFLRGTPQLYDPRCRKIGSVEELRAVMSQADAARMPLFINTSYTEAVMADDPALAALLGDSSRFERTRMLGIEPIFSRDVFRYRGQRP